MITKLILSIIISWLFVKIVKFIIDCSKSRKFSLGFLLHDGGMPSGHTAAVVSLATGLFLETGLSALFVLGVILALIVINDALKVRHITGEQSKALNKLQKDVKFNERVGHKPVEIIVSLIIGVIIPIIIYIII